MNLKRVLSIFILGLLLQVAWLAQPNVTNAFTLSSNNGNFIIPPLVDTTGVSNITSNSALLYGTLSSLGSAGTVSVCFEFGTTTAYGHTTEIKTLSAPGSFSFNTYSMTLFSNTTYHFRARATGDRVSYGKDITFTTLSDSQEVLNVTNDTITYIAANTVTLSAYLNGLGNDSSVQVSFEYGLTPAYGETTRPQIMTTKGEVKVDVPELQPGTLYHYRAKAAGSSITYSDDATFRTFTASSASPSITTREASEVCTQSAYLHSALTATGSSNLVSISFQFGTSSGNYTDETSSIAYGAGNPIPASIDTYINDLTPNTTYYFRAKAIGDSISYGVEKKFTTPAYFDPVQVKPVTDLTTTSVTLNGVAYLDSSTSAQVSFELGTNSGDYTHETDTQNITRSGTNFSLNINGLTPNTTYYFRAKSVGLGTTYSEERSFSTDITKLTGAIAFVNNGNIYTANSDGSNRIQRTTTGNDSDPAISPDGSRIAFTSTRNGNKEIYVLSQNSLTPIRLTNNVADDQEPAWSPDGTRIVFSSSRSGTLQIWAVNADGNNLRRLTYNVSQDTNPSWAPNGKKITFCRPGQYRTDLYVMNTDGSQQTVIASGSSNLGCKHPIWAPDNSKIAFIQEGDQNYISMVNVDGSSFKNIYADYQAIQGIAWSPDGTRIGFGAANQNSWQGSLYFINIDGNNKTQITLNAGDSYPSWSMSCLVYH